MSKKSAFGAAVISISCCGAVADEPPLLVPIKRLSLETALSIARHSVEACRKEGVQIAVAVLDRGGHAQVVLRDVLAPDLTLTISRQKAYTALSFNVSTSALADRANTPLGHINGLAMFPGGVPVQAGGELLGAVGVSGAPSGVTDEACARAGVEAVADDLEMAD
jgi:uncharacterized protein GlcG (DUF336 family)